uniref:Metal-nicotianamine transporter YSL7 n=1 Tax=Fagus sylvatica TaxID=28930 RepID=A0A2N9HCR9_FAGSY
MGQNEREENGFDPEDDHNLKREEEEVGDELSVERIFEKQQVPSWRKQLTVRAFVVSLCVEHTVHLHSDETQPHHRQENTVIQTCVVASSGIAFSGGFGSYLFAMSERVAKQSTDDVDFKKLALGWMIAFLFVVSFLGLFSVVPLRKIMVIDFKLTYPSGTATAHLINSFHTPQGAKLAKKQVRELGKFFSLSFLWGFFQWFYTAGDNCGFASFPSLGLKAYEYKFSGVGHGVCWVAGDEGFWRVERGVFIAIAMILGDGLYNFLKVLSRTLFGLYHQLWNKDVSSDLPVADHSSQVSSQVSYDDKHRTQLFLKDKIPSWFAIGGYVAIAAVSVATLPHIFHELKWYYILVMYIFAPALAFCNAYGAGLTDWSLASTYGNLAIFIIGAWAGPHGGVLAGLAACGVMMNIVSTASDLMQDFKTGYLTLASPRSMFVSQIIGTAMGCVISPCVFWLFYKAFDDLGLPGTQYPAPYAIVFRNMVLLGVKGFSSLPKNCLLLCFLFFGAAILINLTRDLVDKKWGRFIPLPMAMAIPFYIGSYFAIDMCVGSLILFVWEKINKAKADALGPAVASGLICGDGIWTLPASILALAGVKPPICMKFLSRGANAKVDNFLGG